MERNCANDCSSRTNPLYDSNIQGYATTVTNICCQDDGCNSAKSIVSNKLSLVFVLLFVYYILH